MNDSPDASAPSSNSSPSIFHLARQAEWDDAKRLGAYSGSAEDRADGFLHFSTRSQIAESARRHRAGEVGLLLIEAQPAPLGEALVWEPSRGGALFPHLYGDLPMHAVVSATPLELDRDGQHVFPAGF